MAYKNDRRVQNVICFFLEKNERGKEYMRGTLRQLIIIQGDVMLNCFLLPNCIKSTQWAYSEWACRCHLRGASMLP